MKKEYNIRSFFIFIGFIVFYAILIIALYNIQILQKNFFSQLGEKQYETSITTTPPRAPIFDRNGNMLALNKDIVSAFLLPKQIKDPKNLETFLKKHFPESHKRLDKNLRKHFIFIKRKLSKKDIKLIKDSNVEDIHLLKEPNRYYSLECAGPIVGITDIDNNGQFGIEYLFNKQLSGTPTTSSLEKDARSGLFYIKKETTVQGAQGTPVRLTIDSDLQFLCQEEIEEVVDRLEAREGCAMILNPTNGDILAIANYPTFNPNNTTKIDIGLTKNRAVSDVYEPGSVVKAFMAMAALEENVTSPDEIINCRSTRFTTIDRIPVSTIQAHGHLSFTDVIAKSNNIGVVLIAKRLGKTLYDYYKKVGFGAKTGVLLPGEESGFVNPPEKWSAYSLRSLSFGYEITTTLLQLAQAFSIIANDGYMIRPRIILDDNTNLQQKIGPMFSEKTLLTIKEILETSITKGTSRRAAIRGYYIIGKTGTANIIIDGEYSPNRSAYTFSGIIGKGSYKRIIVTMVKDSPKKNLYAANVAAPLFEQIAEKVLIHDRVIKKPKKKVKREKQNFYSRGYSTKNTGTVS
ncbi:penicillin-binding protein 2 [bacterium]|mgnify:CR=1 FL=1|jgi:cell division protein FtsI/penicillin-binding protein 2|nr:penicillin-binding protein 2 [bacterium]